MNFYIPTYNSIEQNILYRFGQPCAIEKLPALKFGIWLIGVEYDEKSKTNNGRG